MAIIPVGAVLTELISHMISVLVLMALQCLWGVRYTFALGWLAYFMLCGTLFLTGYSLLFSTLTVFFRDIPRIISVFVRLLYFLTPIFWSPVNENVKWLLAWNPFSFVLEGYRGAMLSQGTFDIMPWQHIYFWALTVLLLLFGSALHVRLRPYFADYL